MSLLEPFFKFLKQLLETDKKWKHVVMLFYPYMQRRQGPIVQNRD